MMMMMMMMMMSFLSLKQQDQCRYDSTRINRITLFRSWDSFSALWLWHKPFNGTRWNKRFCHLQFSWLWLSRISPEKCLKMQGLTSTSLADEEESCQLGSQSLAVTVTLDMNRLTEPQTKWNELKQKLNQKGLNQPSALQCGDEVYRGRCWCKIFWLGKLWWQQEK